MNKDITCERCGIGVYKLTLPTWGDRHWQDWPNVHATMTEHKIEDPPKIVTYMGISSIFKYNGLMHCTECNHIHPATQENIMPCRDYGDEDRGSSHAQERIDDLEYRNDKLARIACKAMQALEDAEVEDFILLKDKEVREWWADHKAADIKAAEIEVTRIREKIAQHDTKVQDLANVGAAYNEKLEEAINELAKRKGTK